MLIKSSVYKQNPKTLWILPPSAEKNTLNSDKNHYAWLQEIEKTTMRISMFSNILTVKIN